MAARRLQKLRAEDLASRAPEDDESDDEPSSSSKAPYNAFDLLGAEEDEVLQRGSLLDSVSQLCWRTLG